MECWRRDEPLAQAWMALRETVQQELEAARQELAGAA